MNFRLTCLPVIGLLASAAAAQTPAQTPAPTESRPTGSSSVTLPSAPIPKESIRATSRPSESRPAVPMTYHARVQVVLKNQQKLTGIVRNNKFAEVEAGLGFKASEKNIAGSGLRLWFANPGQNWLFLPYKEIQTVNTIGRVSDIEVREIEAQIDAVLKSRLEKENGERTAEVAAEVKARRDKHEEEVKAEADAKKAEKEKQKKEALEKAQKVLDRFPVEAGWGEEKKAEILKKKAAHLYPTPEEQEFMKMFDEWVKAKKLVEAGNKPDGETGGDEDKDKDKDSGDGENESNN